MLGYNFDRQKPIGDYIVEFFCKDLALAIEIDGSSHAVKGGHDLQRQREIETLGVTVLRFDDCEVKNDIEAVWEAIKWQIRELEGR